MNLNLFSKKKTEMRKKINVFELKPDDICFYESEKHPYKVVENGVTSRGVNYVIIKNEMNGKSHIFTKNYLVDIAEFSN